MTSGIKRVGTSSVAGRARWQGSVINCLPLCAGLGGTSERGVGGKPGCGQPQGHPGDGDSRWLSNEVVQKHGMILPNEEAYSSFSLFEMGTK